MLALNRLHWKYVLIILVAVLAVVWFLWPKPPQYTLQAGSRTYKLEAVTAPEAKVKGLGGRSSMPTDAGMLFPFDQAAINRCFWMKDMRFSVDIIWLDADRRVRHIEHSVSPNTYPKEYCPPYLSQYVIELNAGEAKRAGIAEGVVLTF